MLSCVTCHNPHKNADKKREIYEASLSEMPWHIELPEREKDAKPANPGRTNANPCPVEPAKNCIECHMPKVKTPMAHSLFTDHFIRVHARPTWPRNRLSDRPIEVILEIPRPGQEVPAGSRSRTGGKVQYFNVMCASGHRVRGERTEGYQALRCPACGDGVFVLPRSPLPEPVAPSRSAIHQGGRHRRRLDPGGPGRAHRSVTSRRSKSPMTKPQRMAPRSSGKTWLTNTLGNPQSPAAVARRASPEADADQPAGENPAAGAPESAAPTRSRPKEIAKVRRARARDQAEDHAAGGERRVCVGKATRRADVGFRSIAGKVSRPSSCQGAVSRRRALHTLILIAVPLAGRRHGRVANSPAPPPGVSVNCAKRAGRTGIPALDEGNFDKAYQLLSAAKSAVNALGGAVEDADAIRERGRRSRGFRQLVFAKSGRPAYRSRAYQLRRLEIAVRCPL